MRERVAPSQRWRICDDNREDENDQCMELIHATSNFNFVKIGLISHFHNHIYVFANIPLYSAKFQELADKEQIKIRITEGACIIKSTLGVM